MDKTFLGILVLLAGSLLPIQGGLNTKLGKAAENPIYASMFSFVIGAVSLLVYILITRQSASLAGIKAVSGYVWIGGLLGAFYVTIIIVAFPKLGPGVTFGLIVAGQMVMSLILEHNNILVSEQNSINFMRILGIVLIVAGVIIIRKF